MLEPTGSLRDAASTIFNLPDYRVVDAVHLPAGGRMVVVECTAPPGCPAFGVVAVRTHSRRRQVVRDVPVGGPVQVVETDKLWSITCTWWPAIEVLIVTGVTNARTEAAITTNREEPLERSVLLSTGPHTQRFVPYAPLVRFGDRRGWTWTASCCSSARSATSSAAAAWTHTTTTSSRP